MTREPLPGRRQQVVSELVVGNGIYTIGVGFHPDGRAAEVFIDSHKRSSTSDTNARDVAILISLCLQNGVGLDALRKAISREADDSAAGVAGAALDFIKELGAYPLPPSLQPAQPTKGE